MLSVLMPPLCLGCDAALGMDETWLCRECGDRVARSIRPRARWIGLPRGGLLRIDYAMDYGSVVSRLITELKYGDKPGLAGLLARFMGPVADANLDPETVVVPVPISPARRRERGYNQTELLAGHIARSRRLKFDRHGLVKTRATVSQTVLEREERLHNVSRSFGVGPGSDFAGRKVLLVDDVVTTGATLKDCARAVLESGAGEVSACVAASSP